ncbi:hypothetical protein PR048_018031 [Dryococelus australis]|uniref:Uncharacterized protein n=1 Tax=Dryococelus australis TaxID=614101 RepID=A0ABQ9HBA2_9NEOP|nr:hypothetical protein PR048_018031 [Dryococelus australis]
MVNTEQTPTTTKSDGKFNSSREGEEVANMEPTTTDADSDDEFMDLDMRLRSSHLQDQRENYQNQNIWKTTNLMLLTV